MLLISRYAGKTDHVIDHVALEAEPQVELEAELQISDTILCGSTAFGFFSSSLQTIITQV
jgi:hypothetical protein